jgi:hypothetical protein
LSNAGHGYGIDARSLVTPVSAAGLPAAAPGRAVSTPPVVGAVPRVAVSREEAAASLGISIDSFERHVQPDVRLIRRGRLRLVPVCELERWAAEQAEPTAPRR